MDVSIENTDVLVELAHGIFREVISSLFYFEIFENIVNKMSIHIILTILLTYLYFQQPLLLVLNFNEIKLRVIVLKAFFYYYYLEKP